MIIPISIKYIKSNYMFFLNLCIKIKLIFNGCNIMNNEFINIAECSTANADNQKCQTQRSVETLGVSGCFCNRSYSYSYINIVNNAINVNIIHRYKYMGTRI